MSIKHLTLVTALLLAMLQHLSAQTPDRWIRPTDAKSPAIWGIKGGMVFSIWPSAIEGANKDSGGPRGLIRVGYEKDGKVYHINFLAVEPIVDGKMEFSEISNSLIDNRWGKLMWAGDNEQQNEYFAGAKTRGVISHPDATHPEVEELAIYLFMERFHNGAHPYFRLSIRSDKPGELGMEIFNHKGSAPMQRCAISATMGNYGRLRNLYLKDATINSRELYKDFDGIDFVERPSYPADRMLRTATGDLIAIAEPDETLAQLTAWPQTDAYKAKAGWRYRPNFKLTQYWRKEDTKFDPSLHIRVNGRAKYWAVASPNKNDYVNIPGGAAFENFELRENYYSGQKFYFGLTEMRVKELVEGK